MRFFLLCYFYAFKSKAQDSAFVINGNLEKIKSGTIFLNIYKQGETFKDSALLKMESFNLTVLFLLLILLRLPCHQGTRIILPFTWSPVRWRFLGAEIL